MLQLVRDNEAVMIKAVRKVWEPLATKLRYLIRRYTEDKLWNLPAFVLVRMKAPQDADGTENYQDNLR